MSNRDKDMESALSAEKTEAAVVDLVERHLSAFPDDVYILTRVINTIMYGRSLKQRAELMADVVGVLEDEDVLEGLDPTNPN